MNQWLIIAVFCLVLFIYIHIQHQYTTSNDLEVYRVAPKTKEDIEDVMELKQPAVFKFDSPELVEELSLPSLEGTYGDYDVVSLKGVGYTRLVKVLETFRGGGGDVGGITMRNHSFLEETELDSKIGEHDYSLRPPMMCGSMSDIIIGSKNITTPLIYHTQYRNFLLNTFGEVEVMLIPPKYSKHILTTPDYDNLEYISTLNMWVESKENNKIKTIRTVLNEGELLYVPPYWFYSVKFTSTSSILRVSYTTYVNILANLYDVLIQKYRQLRWKVEKIRGGDKEEDGRPEELAPLSTALAPAPSQQLPVPVPVPAPDPASTPIQSDDGIKIEVISQIPAPAPAPASVPAPTSHQ